METWETVVILLLVSVFVVLILNQDIPLSIINVLDNTLFQMTILGLTLSVSIYSPPVAITAIAIIVFVYYTRNIAKIQRILDVDEENIIHHEEDVTISDSPRLNIKEKNVHFADELPDQPSDQLADQQVNQHDDNSDVILNALKEHINEKPNNSPSDQRGGVGTVQIQDEMPLDKNISNIAMPPNNNESKVVEAYDSNSSNQSAAPVSNPEKANSVDSNVFAVNNSEVLGADEVKAMPAIRLYTDDAGQYKIREARPTVLPEKYEVANFLPSADVGSNNYRLSGISIDDKIKNLQYGVLPSSKPPPNFDDVVPNRLH